MRRLAVLAAVPLLVACGGGGEPSAESSPTSKPTPSVTPTPTVTKVDDQVICQLIFEVKDGVGPVQRIIDFWDRDSVSQADVDQLKDDSVTVKDLAARAQMPLSSQLAALAGVIDSYVTAAETGTESTATKTDLQGAGLSLTNTCENYF